MMAPLCTTYIYYDTSIYNMENSNSYVHFIFTLYVCVSVLDLNECTAKPGICKNGRCENTVGSYRCRCDQGFIANPTQTECIGMYINLGYIFSVS